ncbi:MAG: isochorismate synthase [Bacteroidota bacterium]
MDIISTEKFEQFVGEILQNTQNPSPSLAGFAFQGDLKPIEKEIINYARTHEKSFFWEIPARGIMFLGLGELISVVENGKGRFAATEKKIRPWRENFRSNFAELGLESVPVFMGAMKFAPETDSELWSNYSDSNWTVPKILFYKDNDRSFIIYNFLIQHDSRREKIIEEFNFRISAFLNADKAVRQASEAVNPTINAAVSGIAGNTPKDKKKWIENAKKAIEKIESGELEKVVLSRNIEISLNREPEIACLLDQLKRRYRDCYIFAYHSAKSTFFGASPEKLIRISRNRIETDALAGSASRGNTPEEDTMLEEQLLQDDKNLREHITVRNFISSALSQLDCKVTYDEKPAIKKLFNIQHIWTPIYAECPGFRSPFPLLENLHPTPAVCGVPQQEAFSTIKKLELYPRGLYSGIIGWFNFEGEGEFSVALRSALLKGKKLYAFAGCGLVDGSEANTEYKETEMKLKPILSLFTDEAQK